MERTELREAFFAEAKTDPWVHQVAHLAATMWAEGYEQAFRDHGLDEARQRKPFSDRVDDALEFLTDRNREAQAQALISFASLGKLIGDAKVGR